MGAEEAANSGEVEGEWKNWVAAKTEEAAAAAAGGCGEGSDWVDNT